MFVLKAYLSGLFLNIQNTHAAISLAECFLQLSYVESFYILF